MSAAETKGTKRGGDTTGSTNPNNVETTAETKNTTTKRFEEAHARDIAAVQRTLKNQEYKSSSDEEDQLDEKAIMESVYKNYKLPENNQELVLKTSNWLENSLHSGAASCLICIGSVKRSDAIWSCEHCFCFFHLNCIQRWAKDSIVRVRNVVLDEVARRAGRYHTEATNHWCCPQCRKQYTPSEKPEIYKCFCGKQDNPDVNTWIVPHSCGEMCGKNLQPKCGHLCTLLCHPGPCPPCAQYGLFSCLCGKAAPRSLRCFQKEWRCADKCKDMLACGVHRCDQICHRPGECPPCTKNSMQRCDCKAEIMMRSCLEKQWHCQKICNLPYACGLHVCKKVCHDGPCGDCPLGLPRTCHCGKLSKVGPCSDPVESCGHTCAKVLVCGQHHCPRRCHAGDCSLCYVMVLKHCRCGNRTKELACYKEFLCDTKCKQMRDCGKHPCSKKCCDGLCPPCDRVCGKTLSCKKHKCASVCHDGPCYPCGRTSQVNCRCGKTSKTVLCGRERVARVMCQEPCRIPSKCHHPNEHRCHKSDCPPCTQKCDLINTTSGCGHICVAKCHAAVKVEKKMQTSSPKSLWDHSAKYEYENRPHPECMQLVSVTCLGGHETIQLPCSKSKSLSCERPCNRLLNCGNHQCSRKCHAVPDITNMKEQEGCANCEEGCKILRPLGCVHPCPRPCHAPPCAPCNVVIKVKCHCGLMQVMYKCEEFYSVSGEPVEIATRQERLKSCGNRCLKNFPCGHRCNNICHSGGCANPESCRKKVRIFCACKRLKSDVSCDKNRAGLTAMQCDEICQQTQEQQAEIERKKAEALRRDEEEKNRLEMEQFQKKFGKRKYKERKTQVERAKKAVNWQMVSIYSTLTLAVAIAMGVAFYADN